VQLVNEIAMIFCNAERKAVQSHGFVSKWYYRNYHAHMTHLTGAVEYAAFLLPGRNHADFGHLCFLVL